MRVVIATNAQMGASGIGQNRFLETDFCWGLCLSSGFSIPQRPIFGSALRVKEVREKGIVSRNTGAINALLKGVPGNGLVVEKEFEFKPSFDDYLKVMDSVKSNREKKPTASANRIKTRRDLRDKKIASRTREEGQLGDLHGNSSSGRSKLAEQDQLYLSAAGVNLQKGPKCKKVGPKFQGKDKLKDSQSNGFEKKDELDSQGSKLDANVRKKLLPVTPNGILVNKQGRVEAISRMKCFREEKLGHISTEMGGGVEKDHKRGEKVTDRNAALKNMKFNSSSKIIADDTIDNDLKLDRAAFKSLEEFNDICDKPRVSRVDMEERIQKLAKCLNGADIDMPEWMFSKMMRSAKIRFSDHSMLRIIQILGKLGNWRRVLQVVEWIQSRQRFKSHRIRFIYTAALNALGKARRPVEALNLFCAMQQHMSSYPDLVAYHCVAVTLGQAGHMKELFDVIDSMRSPPKKKFKTGVLEKWDPRLEPDVVVYNSVLSACVRRKKWEGAFWVLQQLKQQGLQPSSTTHELVMEVMFVCGKYNLVHDFFKRVQKSSIPNALIYKVIVNTLWREGKTDEAVKAVKDMEKRGIIGSAGLYYDLARCLCSAGRCEEALMQINKICRVANKPLVVAYTGLMQACLDTGHVQNGAYIFNHMQKFCSPNLVTCNILLKAYLDHNMFEEAKELFHELLENGNQISSKSDYRDKVIPDIFTFKLMLDGWFKEQRWDDLEFVYIQMLQYGHPFNAKRHLRMIVEACQAGKRELLETIWRHLAETDRAAPPLLIMERFCMRLEQNDYAGALSCLSNLSLVESPQFSVKSWLRLLSENVHRFPKDTLIRLVNEAGGLLARSNSPNLELKSLIKFCRQFLRNGVTFAEIDQTETFSSSDCETALIS